MKILMMMEYFYPHVGGVERAFLEIGKQIKAKGHSVSIFTTYEHAPYTLPHRSYKKSILKGLGIIEEIYGMEVVRLKLPRIGRRYTYPLFGLPLMFLLFRNVDIVHAGNNYTVSLPSFIFAKLSGKPITMTVWEIWDKLWFSFYPPIIGLFFWVYEKITLSLPINMFITPSQFVYNQIPDINKNQKIIIYPAGKSLRFQKQGRDTMRKKYNIQKNFLYVYYGRFAPNKGVDILLSAFSQVVKTIPLAKLFLFIPQPEEKITQKVNQLISSKKLSSYAHLFPSIPEHDTKQLATVLSMADCIVIPDKTSAFGLSALESSEVSRPIVITTAGAFPEVVHGKVVFVRPQSEKDLVRGMLKIFKKNWKNIPKKYFSWNNTANMYIDVFSKEL